MSGDRAQRPSPIHFIVGTGRCGSSLLHEMICRHRDVRFVSNIDDRIGLPTPVLRRTGALHRLLPPAASTKGRLRFAPSEGYRALVREIGPVLSEPTRDLVGADATPWLRSRTERFFRRRSSIEGDGVLVHKWTGWPRAAFLHAVFPDARFVHVVRDGRAVVNSWLQMPWWNGYRGPDHWQWGPLSGDEQNTWDAAGRSFPVLGAMLWNRLLRAAEIAQLAVPADQWIDVRYEDLIADPHGQTRRVLRHLALDESRATGIGRYRYESGRRDAYHDDLDPVSLAQITNVMAEQLVRFGYHSPDGDGSAGGATSEHNEDGGDCGDQCSTM